MLRQEAMDGQRSLPKVWTKSLWSEHFHSRIHSFQLRSGGPPPGAGWETYGSTLHTGQYSIDPATAIYHFNNTTDSGRGVTLSYSYLLTTMNQQENDLVPAGLTILVGGSLQFVSDLGVHDTNTSAAFTRVSGTPTVAGTYQVTGSAPASYKFSTPDINREVTITYSIKDPNAVGQGQSTQLNFTLNTGTQGQSPFSFLTASYPGAAFGYTNLATLLYQPMGLGASAQIQQNKFEVITLDVYGGGIGDCNPVTCITQVLTNSVWGLGVGPTPFPASVLDNGVGGTWGGGPSTPGSRVASGQAWNWFAANNFFISPVIDTRDSAASIMGKWLEAGMCAAFMSEGLLKLVPYGDTTTALNGVTWIARLDDAVFKYTYDPTWRGQTLHFKFQAVNAFGNNAQPLSSLTPVSFTVPGLNKGSVDASTGLVVTGAAQLDAVADGVTYVRVANVATDHTFHASTALNNQGSIPSAGVNTFSYTSTTTSIKTTWTAFTVYNPDGSTISVPANRTGTTFSGLSPSTTYYLGFYVVVATGTCVAVLSDVSSGAAPLSVQYITHTLNGDGHVGINWNITAATPASGTGSGSGGGGGTGTCFTPNTRLLDLTPISKVRVGDLVWVESGNGSLVQRPVGEVLAYEYDGILRNVEAGTWVTPSHLFKQADGSWERADEMFPKTMHYAGTVHNLHIETQDDSERNYVLWNRVVAHNYKLL